MVEYVIELLQGDTVTGLLHIERDGRHSVTKPTPAGYSHVKKFRVKDRAVVIAAKYPNARLAQTYGGYCYGSKSIVVPKQSPVNRTTPYRSV